MLVDDEVPKGGSDALSAMERESLDDFSLDDLDDRIARLKIQISRAEQTRAKKATSMTVAEAAFKKP